MILDAVKRRPHKDVQSPGSFKPAAQSAAVAEESK
jgi:hypothetical protein